MDDGLTVQTGLETVPPTEGFTVQPNVIGPTKPVPVTTVIEADEDPPGATALGDRFGSTVIVKSAAEARGSATNAAAIRHKAATQEWPIHNFTLDSQ